MKAFEPNRSRYWIESLYRLCLALYPARFRESYGDAMLIE